jgi:acyl-CoA dehydrogenase
MNTQGEQLGIELADAASRMLDDLGPAARHTQDPTPLWDAMAASGIAQALVPEQAGGAGLSWQDAQPMLSAVAREGVPSPLPEALLGAWLAARCEATAMPGLCVACDGSELMLEEQSSGLVASGTLRRVPWARHATQLLAVTTDARSVPRVVVLDPGLDGVLRHGTNLAGEARDTLVLSAHPVRRLGRSPVDAEGLRALGAALRCVQIAAAIAQALSLTTEYVNLRVQFGRRLSQFQAVQHPVAQMASLAAATHSAAVAALEAIDGHDAEGTLAKLGNAFQIASAKVFCGEAAGQCASISHQAFGAIGFTREHGLHLLTRRLWSWRDECGNETHWSRRIGTAFRAGGSDSLWPALTRGRYPDADPKETAP